MKASIRHELAVKSPITFWHYSGFGIKSSPFFGFAKSSKYKTIIPLSQMPKSVVVAVMPSVFYLLNFSVSLLHRFEVRNII
ncbi:hypothetical protein [Flavobacterium aquicola]|uniref:hypothetical protein n=1 Tax=Flavobacterium aquicola TaxID=1682742 RepID=UPI000E289380|nr:hypothetical protein [Flavobacterium aquicola]